MANKLSAYLSVCSGSGTKGIFFLSSNSALIVEGFFLYLSCVVSVEFRNSSQLFSVFHPYFAKFAF